RKRTFRKNQTTKQIETNLFFGTKIVLNVKGFANFLGSFAANHIGHGFASGIEKTFDIEVVGGQNKLEKGALIHLQKVSIPGVDVIGAFLAVIVVFFGHGIVLVVFGPLDHFAENGAGNILDRHRLGVVFG